MKEKNIGPYVAGLVLGAKLLVSPLEANAQSGFPVVETYKKGSPEYGLLLETANGICRKSRVCSGNSTIGDLTLNLQDNNSNGSVDEGDFLTIMTVKHNPEETPVQYDFTPGGVNLVSDTRSIDMFLAYTADSGVRFDRDAMIKSDIEQVRGSSGNYLKRLRNIGHRRGH